MHLKQLTSKKSLMNDIQIIIIFTHSLDTRKEIEIKEDVIKTINE